ncbi:MAG: class I SAM-dependent methyltransferase [Acidobacteria bacterium]|nr:class I SAM-dependent methyltransferase [Acidobacteriota bacterium]
MNIEDLKARLHTTWTTGDYETFACYMEPGALVFYDRLGVDKGARLLDVGCGAGQVALIAARNGAIVTGCDIAENWIEKAQSRAFSEGLTAVFEVGDAENLPYHDGEFDVVISMVGAMFAPRPELVAAEMKRVCRSGGTIAMANWTPEGFIGQMFKAIAKHIAPPGMPSPVLWGSEPVVRERMRDGILALTCTKRMYPFVYPFPPEDVVEFFRVHYGPMTRAFEAAGQSGLREDLVALWSSANTGLNGTTHVEAEYLEVVAVRA